MTIEEAIQHCHEVAAKDCTDCGKEHEQLASWLTELQVLRAAQYEKGKKAGEKGVLMSIAKYLMEKSDDFPDVCIKLAAGLKDTGCPCDCEECIWEYYGGNGDA